GVIHGDDAKSGPLRMDGLLGAVMPAISAIQWIPQVPGQWAAVLDVDTGSVQVSRRGASNEIPSCEQPADSSTAWINGITIAPPASRRSSRVNQIVVCRHSANPLSEAKDRCNAATSAQRHK